MAKILKLCILNSSDKTRHYSVATGEGAITSDAGEIVTNVVDFPIGSQYTDTENKKFYVRMAGTGAYTDWTCINSAE